MASGQSEGRGVEPAELGWGGSGCEWPETVKRAGASGQNRWSRGGGGGEWPQA